MFEERDFWGFLVIGKEDGFKYLYDHFHKKIIGYCINKGLSREESEEITQEIFVKIWKNIDKIERGQNIRSYIFTSAKNIIIDSFRKKAKEIAAKEYQYYFLGYSLETENNVLFNELKNEVDRTLEDMPDIQEIIFKMSRFKGYSNIEIAEELGISVKTVEAHITKAIKKFRQTLGYSSSGLISLTMLFQFIFYL